LEDETAMSEEQERPGTNAPKHALQSAASVAGLMLTTEALVTEIKEKEKAPAGMPGGGGMY
jgi:chaperonin GroEL